ncbi:MAG: hypothetical protein ACD_60C00126G0018 [uncultured bacterium]|nr:MAG: hypothetical protein ACD_60C00126G0018 [uncultured bacterium]
MLIKKINLGLAIAALSLPIVALSNPLHVNNNTSKDSAVRVTSSILPLCSGDSGHFTPAHNQSDTKPSLVRALCGAQTGICTADMYPAKDCTGEKVATLSINLDTLEVVSVIPIDPKYSVTAHGSTVDINCSASDPNC